MRTKVALNLLEQSSDIVWGIQIFQKRLENANENKWIELEPRMAHERDICKRCIARLEERLTKTLKQLTDEATTTI